MRSRVPLKLRTGRKARFIPGICRGLSRETQKARIANEAYALRLDVAKAKARIGHALAFEERGRGPAGETGMQQAKPESLGDVVLARKEMPTSYHLAVVVEMGHGDEIVIADGNFPSASIARRLVRLDGHGYRKFWKRC